LLKPAYEGHLREPSDGLNVQLALDMGIQRIAEEELDRGLEQFIAKRGTAIVIEPRCGGILAMVSRPNYNLNRRERIKEASLNFATQAIYEPGSTFKIIAVSGALEAGVVRPLTTIDCHEGYFREGAIVVHDHHPYGWLTVEEVIEKSSNIGAYMIARRLGRKRFFEMGRRLGFGRKTGIRLSGESFGVFRDTANAVDFSRVAYGYAANVTPLQVACAYASIANGGRLMRPRIVSRVVSNDGRMIEQINPEMICRAMRPNTAARVRKALEMVVSDKGTARRAKVPGYRVGGKTGTARKHQRGGGYIKGHYTVSFAGIMPIDNPAFVCVVVVDDPRIDPAITPHYGGTIAAPIFARIAGRVAEYMHLVPTEPVDEPEEGGELAGEPTTH
jgi:cell division protein FtsI/penicillin-binding protein 2